MEETEQKPFKDSLSEGTSRPKGTNQTLQKMLASFFLLLLLLFFFYWNFLLFPQTVGVKTRTQTMGT